MASISTDPGGGKRIQFLASDGSRKAVRLGRVAMRDAQAIKLKIEALAACQLAGGFPDVRTAEWIAELPDKLHERLARAGLVKARTEQARLTLAGFIDGYVADRTDAKPRTLINMRQARTDLVAFFGEGKLLRDVTEGDAEEFWRHLLRRKHSIGDREGLAQNTARRIIGRAKQFFRAAIRKRLIRDNPFGGLKSRVQGNSEREFFVTREMAEKVLDACPDAEWRLIFALSRFGGLRCPSEHLALKWSDIDWGTGTEGGKVRVRSPKTEHHEGKESRMIPLFPELRPYLQDAFDLAEPGAEFVIARYRGGDANLRTRMERIIRKAGLTPWPKTFHNLRSTRQTELAESFPIHVVTAWIGNSERIAREHYLQVRESDFQRASGPGIKAAHKTAQQAPESPCKPLQALPKQKQQVPNKPELAVNCLSLQDLHLPPRGVEQVPFSAGNHAVRDASGAESGAFPAQTGHQNGALADEAETGLAEVAAAWPKLPADARKSILAMVRQATSL